MLEHLDPAVSQVLGWLPPGLGHHTIAQRWYRRRYRELPNGTFKTTRMRSGAVLDLDIADRMQGEASVVRDYEPAVTAFLASQLKDGGAFFDIGANVGMVSFSVAALARPARIMIHAFEPAPRNADRFRRNMALNPDVDVHLNEVGVSDRAGSLTLVATDPEDKDSNYSFRDEVSPRARHEVRVVTLDEYVSEHGVERIDVMKVDVEGFEAKVLNGARRVLETLRPRCIVCEADEAQGQALLGILDGYGYALADLPPVGLRIKRSHARGEKAFLLR